MESLSGYRYKWIVFWYELLGTCLLCFSVVISGGKTFAVAGALFALNLIFGPMSGAHFNPGFSVAVYVKEIKSEHSLEMLAIYVMAEVIGALLGT